MCVIRTYTGEYVARRPPLVLSFQAHQVYQEGHEVPVGSVRLEQWTLLGIEGWCMH